MDGVALQEGLGWMILRCRRVGEGLVQESLAGGEAEGKLKSSLIKMLLTFFIPEINNQNDT